MVIAIISILLFLFYAALIIYYITAWRSIPDFNQTTYNHTTRFSVIIPARNEEKNIGTLLSTLEHQDYPRHLYEVIVVDDHSEDRTAAIVNRFAGTKLISLDGEERNSYKKYGIEKAIEISSGDLIVTTDADCTVKKHWLSSIASFHETTNAGFIVAPVVFNNKDSILEKFQVLDFLSLQGITAASVHRKMLSMCNGANLIYKKKLFEAVNGFTGIDQIASGDDMLLMHKIAKKFPEQIRYMKSQSTIVTTAPMSTWKEFFNQRIRWASKATYYEDKKIFLVLLLVYLFNLSLLVLFVAGFWEYNNWIALGLLLLLKTVVEWIFISRVASFFHKRKLLFFFPFFQPLHILYTVFAGLISQFGKYEWKGRRVR